MMVVVVGGATAFASPIHQLQRGSKISLSNRKMEMVFALCFLLLLLILPGIELTTCRKCKGTFRSVSGGGIETTTQSNTGNGRRQKK